MPKGIYIRKKSPWNKGLTKENDERLEKISIANKGKNNSMYGKQHTEEEKRKIREGNLGKYDKHTKEGIESIRKHMQERIISIKTRNKMSETRKKLFREGILINPMLGKKRPDTSEWMKTEKNIGRFNKHPSKPQLKLFEMVKQKYPNAVLEYPLKINHNKVFWLDIAVPLQKLNFEYDGEYWHKLNSRKYNDSIRDEILLNLEWKVIRINEKILKQLLNDEVKIFEVKE